MTAKQRAAEDLLADLNDLPDDPNVQAVDAGDADEASINEFLAEFSKDRERPSRPMTPRLANSKARASPGPSAASGSSRTFARRSAEASRASSDSKRSVKDETATFTNSSTANSDKDEKSDETESVRSDTKPEPSTGHESSQKKVYGSGSSWSAWGGSLWSTANSIQTQIRAEAEKRLADLQASEEAQKLQARIRELDLSKLASEARNIGQGVLDAVAPPIEDNETLVVNVFHDLGGLRVEASIYSSFERVMEQVEGGSLRVVAKDRDGSLELNAIPENASGARKLNLATIEDAVRAGPSDVVERTSNIYLSIQAFTAPSSDPAAEEKEGEATQKDDENQFLFTLVDPANAITFTATSQSFPASWIPLSLQTVEAAIQPREWISAWIEEALQLTAGVLAQRYVARRMGMDSSEQSGQPTSSDGKEGGLKVREGQDLSEAGLGL